MKQEKLLTECLKWEDSKKKYERSGEKQYRLLSNANERAHCHAFEWARALSEGQQLQLDCGSKNEYGKKQTRWDQRFCGDLIVHMESVSKIISKIGHAQIDKFLPI